MIRLTKPHPSFGEQMTHPAKTSREARIEYEFDEAFPSEIAWTDVISASKQTYTYPLSHRGDDGGSGIAELAKRRAKGRIVKVMPTRTANSSVFAKFLMHAPAGMPLTKITKKLHEWESRFNGGTYGDCIDERQYSEFNFVKEYTLPCITGANVGDAAKKMGIEVGYIEMEHDVEDHGEPALEGEAYKFTIPCVVRIAPLQEHLDVQYFAITPRFVQWMDEMVEVDGVRTPIPRRVELKKQLFEE